MSFNWLGVVDVLIVERGERNLEGYYKATFTSTEILEAVGQVVNQSNHRNALRFVQAYYPESTAESIGVTGRDGWTLHIKIRTK